MSPRPHLHGMSLGLLGPIESGQKLGVAATITEPVGSRAGVGDPASGRGVGGASSQHADAWPRPPQMPLFLTVTGRWPCGRDTGKAAIVATGSDSPSDLAEDVRGQHGSTRAPCRTQLSALPHHIQVLVDTKLEARPPPVTLCLPRDGPEGTWVAIGEPRGHVIITQSMFLALHTPCAPVVRGSCPTSLATLDLTPIPTAWSFPECSSSPNVLSPLSTDTVISHQPLPRGLRVKADVGVTQDQAATHDNVWSLPSKASGHVNSGPRRWPAGPCPRSAHDGHLPSQAVPRESHPSREHISQGFRGSSSRSLRGASGLRLSAPPAVTEVLVRTRPRACSVRSHARGRRGAHVTSEVPSVLPTGGPNERT